MIEVWKDIEGYNNYYQVSNYGRVRTLYKKGGTILKLHTNNGGYIYCRLRENGKRVQRLVHRLVAQAFIENPNNLLCINHKDECKINNFVWVNEDGSIDLEKSNLEWCTYQYNNTYGTRIEKMVKSKINGKRSKKILQLTLNGDLIKIYPSLSEAQRDGFARSNIAQCAKGNWAQAYGYKWQYANP